MKLHTTYDGIFFSSIKVTMREAKAAKIITLIKTGVLTGEASDV